MRKNSSALFTLSALGLASLALMQPVWASGYHFGTQSVGAQATANASSAEAPDPSTIFYNPAGLTHLPGAQFSGNLNLIAPSVKYENATGRYPTAPNAIAGQTSGKITKSLIAVPHLYGSYQINDRWTAGLGIYVPFASETEYQPDSVLRYNVNKTKLTAIDINPTLGFKLTDKHSLGFGLIAQHATAELRQYANWAPFFPPRPNGAVDGMANIKGSSWGLGYNLGWLWDASDNVRVGASYRSKINHTLKGDADWSFANPALGNTPAGVALQSPLGTSALARGYLKTEGAEVKVVTPASLSLHGMWKANPQWNLFGDVTWTQHSAFNTLNLQYANAKAVANAVAGGVTSSNTTIIKPHWRDTFKVAVGASYQVSQPLQVRFGVAYDQSPVRSADERLSTMPDNDRIWLSAGLKYDFNKNSTLNLAYSYIHIKNASANVNGWCGSSVAAGPGAANCVSSRTTGSADFKSYAQILGIGYTYRF